MVRENQILVDVHAAQYVCLACDEREFGSEESLLQHCRTATCHRAEWCDRCEWMLVSADARENHITDSARHWLCGMCGIDMLDEDELIAHEAMKHSFCHACQVPFANYSNHRLESHFRCQQC